MALILNGDGTITGLAVGGLPDGTVDSGTLATDSVTSANIADGTITTDDILASDVVSLKSGRKNLIINGGFDVWQRGTSFTGTKYGADRFVVWGDHTTAIPQTINSNGLNKAIRLTKNSDTSSYSIHSIEQRIEDGLERFNSKTITISFSVRASKNLTATIGTAGTTWGSQNNLEAGVSSSITTSWQKVSHTFSYSTATTGTLFICPLWSLNSVMSAGDWIELANVQLELGSVATDFEHRSYGEELALCQRYYQAYVGTAQFMSMGLAGAAQSGTWAECAHQFPEMRVAPTAAISAAGTFYILGANEGIATSATIFNTTKTASRIAIYKAGLVAAQAYTLAAQNSSARISYDAEL